MRYEASQLAAAIDGTVHGADVTIDGAAFDSRELRPGQLFVPIVAERDGHEFISSAAADGAAAYLTSIGAVAGLGATAIAVGDTSAALLEAGAWARRRLDAALDAVVGVTGSVGKTSTKDLAAAAIGAGRRVAANVRSFNNHLGLPVTLLSAPDDTEVLITELGMNHLGEIARLCEIARPTIGVVTAVGAAHTGPLGGIDGVARAKAELVQALPAGGTAILNADDERVTAMSVPNGVATLRYGNDPTADVGITDLQLDDLARPRFIAETPWGRVELHLAVSGAHMASNAAAALAAAGAVGVPIADAAAALATAELSARRMQRQRTASGALLINDAYNANPLSMIAALDALAAVEADRRVAVVGLMAELDDPVTAHRDVAREAHRRGIELIAVGTDLYGTDPVDDPVVALGELDADVAIVVKASLVAGFDRVAEAIVAA